MCRELRVLEMKESFLQPVELRHCSLCGCSVEEGTGDHSNIRKCPLYNPNTDQVDARDNMVRSLEEDHLLFDLDEGLRVACASLEELKEEEDDDIDDYEH